MGEDSVGILILPLLRLLAWGYFLMPAPAKRAVTAAVAALLRAARLREGVVRQNLEIAFPSSEAGSAERRPIVFRQAYEHLAALSLEILMLLGPMRRFVLARSELRGGEHWKKASEGGRGVIFLSGHLGNWEVMAATGALHGGMDLLIVTKHLKPEWLHRAIEAGRARCGVKATYEPRTLKDVLAHLKRGGTVGFVLDQYAGAPVGVRVPLFGLPVGTPTVVALLAKRTGAPVLPVVNSRRPDGRFVVEVREPLRWIDDPDPAVELAANTAHYAATLQGDILAHPGQWLWIHRRFKGDLSPLREGEWSEGRARR